MMSRTILVTGAAGFLGSHLCDALLAAGDTVIGVDNLSTGNHANLAHLKNESRFSLLERDITKPFDASKIDFLFNLASPASPVDYTRLGVETRNSCGVIDHVHRVVDHHRRHELGHDLELSP